MQEHFPGFLASATVISASLEMHAYLTSVAIANANVSARGPTRQIHDLITWASNMIVLSPKGVDSRIVHY